MITDAAPITPLSAQRQTIKAKDSKVFGWDKEDTEMISPSALFGPNTSENTMAIEAGIRVFNFVRQPTESSGSKNDRRPAGGADNK